MKDSGGQRVPTPNFEVLFQSIPGRYLVLSPDLLIVAVSNAYLEATMTERDEILGRGLFEVFPDDPGEPDATGTHNLRVSLDRVRQTLAADTMAIQKYGIRKPASEGGAFEERTWSAVNSPVVSDAGELIHIIHCVQDVTEMVRAKKGGVKLEEELGHQQDLFERFFALSPDLLCIAGLDGYFRRVNPACSKLGYDQGELLTRPYMDFVHPDDQASTLLAMEELSHGHPSNFANRYRCKDGSYRWLNWTVAPDASGVLHAAARDITELKDSNHFLETIVENIPLMVFVKGATELEFVKLNRAGEALLGRSEAELLGKSAHDFFPKEQADFFEAKDREALQASAAIDILEEEILTPSGTRLLRTKKVSVVDASGTPRYLLGIAEDISDLRSADEARSRLAAIVEWSDDAIISETPDGVITSWNAGAEAIYGYTAEEMIGRSVALLIPEDRQGEETRLIARIRAGQAVDSFETIRRRKDGQVVHASVSLSLLRDRAGIITGVAEIARDITREKHAASEQDRRKMDAIGKLASGIAHDFNNILAVILSYASFIRDELPEDDAKRDDIGEVLSAAERAAGLTRQLLTFSRQLPTTKRRQNLNENLLQLRKHLFRSVGAHIDLRVEPAARDAVVLIDPVQFDQLVLNLAINARDAMPNGGRLFITLERSSESPAQVVLKVADNGKGMAPATQARIFEPFFTTKEKGKGIGLGLATSFGIVADAGGTFRVESKPGVGTTFFVELPLAEGAADAALSSLAKPQAGRGQTILVVEDEPGLRRIAARVLENAGYEVHLASDGDEAIACIDEMGARLDLVLSDVVMPGRSGGYDVVAHAARKIPGTPMVLMSGFFERSRRRNYRPDLPILWKPASPTELVLAVAGALAGGSPTESAGTAAAGKMILLVDDDAALLKALGRLLERAGYATQKASCIAEARKFVESGVEVWLVLCDLSLPDGSGGEFLRWLRDTRPALLPRLYLLTGGAISQADRQLVKSDAFHVLTKPIDPKLLVEILDELRDAAPPSE